MGCVFAIIKISKINTFINKKINNKEYKIMQRNICHILALLFVLEHHKIEQFQVCLHIQVHDMFSMQTFYSFILDLIFCFILLLIL